MAINSAAARNFVETHGGPIDRARLHALLDNIVPAALPEDIGALQNADGGFALELKPGRPSALSTTCYVLTWLRDLRLAEHDAAQRALQFVLARQARRGIWREAAALQAYNPPAWMDPEAPAADIYTTAICASTVAVLTDDELAVEIAVNWLQTQQGRDGLLNGFKAHSSWLAVPAFVTALGHETRATRRLIAGLGQLLSPEWNGTMLAWLLQALLDGGYSRRTEVFNRAWIQLEAAQQPDGSFSTEEGEDSVHTTLQALSVAVRLNEQ